MKTLLTCAASLMALGAVAAYADSHKEMDDKKMDHGDMFSKMDADGDGAVTQAEYTAHVIEKAMARFDEMSGDDDILTMAEVEAHHAEMMEKKKDKMDGKKKMKKAETVEMEEVEMEMEEPEMDEAETMDDENEAREEAEGDNM